MNKSRNIIYMVYITIIVTITSFIFLVYKTETKNYHLDIMNEAVKDTVKIVENYGILTGKYISRSSELSPQWTRKIFLIENANTNELYKLIDYPNGTIKAIAYEALLTKNINDQYFLLIKALMDTSTFVFYLAGDIVETKMLGEYLVDDLLNLKENYPPSTLSEKISIGLNDLEIENIRKMLNENLKRKQDIYNYFYD